MKGKLFRKIAGFFARFLHLDYLDILPRTGFFAMRYQMHNQRRLEHLSSLGLPLAGKEVLEVGAGIGDHTHFFLDRNCRIEATEARKENVVIFKKRYPSLPMYQHDMDNPYQKDWQKTYEIVYCYGLLYHLQNPEQAIKFMSEKCASMLLLETMVSYGDEEAINNVKEIKAAESQSYTGTGCRPTRLWVWNTLKKHFPYVYVTKTQPNHEQFPTDWEKEPEGGSRNITRSVFIASREPIKNDLLSDTLIMKQVKGY